jgi:hypothetical protein
VVDGGGNTTIAPNRQVGPKGMRTAFSPPCPSGSGSMFWKWILLALHAASLAIEVIIIRGL